MHKILAPPSNPIFALDPNSISYEAFRLLLRVDQTRSSSRLAGCLSLSMSYRSVLPFPSFSPHFWSSSSLWKRTTPTEQITTSYSSNDLWDENSCFLLFFFFVFLFSSLQSPLLFTTAFHSHHYWFTSAPAGWSSYFQASLGLAVFLLITRPLPIRGHTPLLPLPVWSAWWLSSYSWIQISQSIEPASSK